VGKKKSNHQNTNFLMKNRYSQQDVLVISGCIALFGYMLRECTQDRAIMNARMYYKVISPLSLNECDHFELKLLNPILYIESHSALNFKMNK
jgi:hypothetical protein